jgi:hypothetical protein
VKEAHVREHDKESVIHTIWLAERGP